MSRIFTRKQTTDNVAQVCNLRSYKAPLGKLRHLSFGGEIPPSQKNHRSSCIAASYAPNKRARKWSHVKFSTTRRRAAWLIRSTISGCRYKCSSALAMASTSPGRTMIPSTPSRMTSPASRVVICGNSLFFQAEDGIRDADVTGVQTCALPILHYDEERMRVVVELLSAAPDMSEND